MGISQFDIYLIYVLYILNRVKNQIYLELNEIRHLPTKPSYWLNFQYISALHKNILYNPFKYDYDGLYFCIPTRGFYA